MSKKSIQEQFGQATIDAMTLFAKRDIGTISDLQTNEFSHVANPKVKKAMAETLYGSRWIYKTGLAMLANGVEQHAHVRAQIIDYTSIAEALLIDAITVAFKKGKLSGPQHTNASLQAGKVALLTWNAAHPHKTVEGRPFKWQIIVASESGIINSKLATDLQKMREHRNTVHIVVKAANNTSYSADLAKEALSAMNRTIKQTKAWMAANP